MTEKDILAIRGMQDVKNRLAKKYCYLAPALFILDIVPQKSEMNMGTDGNRLYINTQYILERYVTKKGKEELQYRYLHVVLHCLLGHVFRKTKMDDELYDACADICVEKALRRIAGKKRALPASVQCRRNISDILQHPYSFPYLQCTGEKDLKMREDMILLGKYFSSDDHDKWFVTQGNQNHEADSMWRQIPKSAEKLWEKVLNQIVVKQQRLEQTNNMESWETFERSSQKEYVCSTEENQMSYQDVLRDLLKMREITKVNEDEFDYMWYRLGLDLYDHMPIMEPLESMEQPCCRNLIIAIDTSGSCQKDVVARFLRETQNIVRDIIDVSNQATIRILQCDNVIRKKIIIENVNDMSQLNEMWMEGFGGTSFCPVFQYIEELKAEEKMEVDGLIYLSDGWGDYPEEKPTGYPTYFVLNREDNETGKDLDMYMPEWVQRIYLTDDKEELK